ncbi:MAG: NIPSNAP family protein [Burkholderiales bacterium]|nr:NIPSNAP family protein [Burkholderiales bacterium]
MIYELRIYHCMPGRLPDLNKRFETITLKIWERHGIRQAGFWTVLVGDSNQDLYYLLEWKDMAERERVWNGFMADPEWQEKRAETERNGPLVAKITNLFLTPTQYSRIK